MKLSTNDRVMGFSVCVMAAFGSDTAADGLVGLWVDPCCSWDTTVSSSDCVVTVLSVVSFLTVASRTSTSWDDAAVSNGPCSIDC